MGFRAPLAIPPRTPSDARRLLQLLQDELVRVRQGCDTPPYWGFDAITWPWPYRAARRRPFDREHDA